MVLFAKNALTKAYLLSNRAFSTTQSNQFAYLIRNIPKPAPKVPHPTHVKCNFSILNDYQKTFFKI
jgi:hypothetical protein